KVRIIGFEKLSGAWDFLLYALRIPVFTAKIGDSPEKTIVYVGEFLPPRTARMAKWLKRKNKYRTVLLCSRHGYVSAFTNNSFDRTFLFRNAWHLRRILRSLPPIWLMHSFAPKSHFPDVARETLPGVPFIHDMQDVYATYYGTSPALRWLQRELPHEKNCLTYADGVVAHCLEANVGFRRYGITEKPPTLFFPLYCDDDCFIDNAKKISDSEIHLAYAGGVAGSHRDPGHYGNIQFHRLIETLTAQGLHFHIYPSPSNIRADYEEYEALDKTNPRFHFHKPVKQEALAEELSKYHFGILPFFKELSEQSPMKLKYATTLKLFNYLEAGLPVIVSGDLGFQSWLVKRYDFGVVIALADVGILRAKLEAVPDTHFPEQVRRARQTLALSRHVNRLENFYRTTSARKFPESR
ncbi:MAG TPA: hypothetical protein VK826_03085, partial [Bacteroidia bacterium]|nr:hypothetical protein [Bacteroidia bacterium]